MKTLENAVVLVVAGLVALGCGKCPKCPENRCDSDGAKDVDSGEEGTDSGVKPAPLGQAIKKVTSFELYGRAGFDRVSIWSEPDMESPRLGYLRKGARVRLGNPAYTTEGCPKGWFVLPEGGYVCQGRGMLVGNKPRYIRHAPPPARRDQLDPYPHGFVRRDFTPSYRRLPALEEMWKPPVRYVPGTYTVFVPADGGGDAAAGADGGDGMDSQTDAPTGQRVEIIVDEKGDLQLPEGVTFEKDEDNNYILPKGVVIPTEEIPHVDPDVPKDTAEGAEQVVGIDYYRYAQRHFKGIKQFLQRGFWVSVGRRFRDEATGQFYYETIKGEYVPGNMVHMVRPPSFRGYRVYGDTPLPAVIVNSRYAAFYEKRNNKFRGVGPVDRLQVYRVLGQEKQGASTYYEIEGQRYLKESQVVYFDLREPPQGVSPDEQWILVDLSRQTLEAYDGTTPILVTLISSGLPDSEETVTPTGTFNITFKHVTDDMTGSVGDGADVYQVEDVPYVQYIHRNIALHASFWHSSYGHPKSHGCINLAPADAAFLFDWTKPALPDGWHGVAANEAHPGTKVIIIGKTPN